MESLVEFDKKRNVVPTPEIMMFPSFKKLYTRDKSRGKIIAISELSYIYYMCVQNGKKNPYYLKYADQEEEKSEEIIRDLFTKEWTPDKLVRECIELFKKNNYKEAEDTRDALITTKAKLKEWFKTFDPEKDTDGLKIQRNTKTIQELTKVIKEYDKLVIEEESDTLGITGGGTLGEFEEL